MRPRSPRRNTRYHNSRYRNTKYVAAALVTFALVAAACGGGGNSNDGDAGQTTEAAANTTPNTTGDTASSNTDDTEPATTDVPVVSEGQIAEEIVEEEQDPVFGGTLRYGLEADVDGLNPTSSALSSPGLTMGHAVFDTIAAYSAEGEPVPYLAESIKPVDGDLSKWRVTLRPDIVFHAGTPLNSEALQVNFESQRADLS